MPSIDLPHLLGERGPAAAQARRVIRKELLVRRSLAPTDHQAILDHIENALNEATILRDQLRDNPKDEQKRRKCLALITEGAYLASDDEGRFVLWLRKRCIDLTGITKDTPLLPLTLKAYGPYNYNGDARCRRNSDKKVSRDHKAITRRLSQHVLPPDLVNTWNQSGCGVDASSRPGKAAGVKPNFGRSKQIIVTADAGMHRHATSHTDWTKMIWLVEGKGNQAKLQGVVSDPSIVKDTVSQIRRKLAAATVRRPT